MSLLTPNDLKDIKNILIKTINTIEKLTDKNIINFLEYIYNSKYNNELIGIIPITSGKGKIDLFSESIHETLNLFNINSFITKNTDVSGYYEAIEKKADIILMADDNTYLAFNINKKKITNNNYATGKIYSNILIHSNTISCKKEVLVIGLGNVGIPAIINFLNNNYDVYIYDINSILIKKIIKKYPKLKEYSLLSNKKFHKIFEATPSKNTIKESMITKNTIISTPGIPRAISEYLENKYNISLIMEPLGIGTIGMLYDIF